MTNKAQLIAALGAIGTAAVLGGAIAAATDGPPPLPKTRCDAEYAANPFVAMSPQFQMLCPYGYSVAAASRARVSAPKAPQATPAPIVVVVGVDSGSIFRIRYE